jgi:hypothetical protein
MNLLLISIGSLFFLVLVSFGVEALRRRPNAPTTCTGIQGSRSIRP